nr:ATP-binding cassette domain-containing protein [Gulosibacter chungangensis]
MLGPSGCGKTTLMRSIVGVQKLAGGSVEVLGKAAGSRSLRHRVAYDTQSSSVYSDLTVWTRRCAATGCCSLEPGLSSPTPHPRGSSSQPGRPTRSRRSWRCCGREPAVPIRMRLDHRIHPADTQSREKSNDSATQFGNGRSGAAPAQPRSAVDRTHARGPEPARWAIRVAL